MAANVQCLQKYRKSYDDQFSVNKYLHHCRFCFHKNRRVNKSFSFFRIYFRYVDVVLMRDFRNKMLNIAERIQSYQIRRAGTDCLTNPRWFPDTQDDIFSFILLSFDCTTPLTILHGEALTWWVEVWHQFPLRIFRHPFV